MFTEIFEKVDSFAHHHQALFAFIVGVSAICFSWGVEKLLEEYLFPNNKLYGYLTAIFGGLSIMWLTKHFVLHVF
jgi:hypothetical protein